MSAVPLFSNLVKAALGIECETEKLGEHCYSPISNPPDDRAETATVEVTPPWKRRASSEKTVQVETTDQGVKSESSKPIAGGVTQSTAACDRQQTAPLKEPAKLSDGKQSSQSTKEVPSMAASKREASYWRTGIKRRRGGKDAAYYTYWSQPRS